MRSAPASRATGRFLRPSGSRRRRRPDAESRCPRPSPGPERVSRTSRSNSPREPERDGSRRGRWPRRSGFRRSSRPPRVPSPRRAWRARSRSSSSGSVRCAARGGRAGRRHRRAVGRALRGRRHRPPTPRSRSSTSCSSAVRPLPGAGPAGDARARVRADRVRVRLVRGARRPRRAAARGLRGSPGPGSWRDGVAPTRSAGVHRGAAMIRKLRP